MQPTESPSTPRHPRIVLVALNDLHRDVRLLKQASSFHQAGFDVIRVGIQVSASDALEEQTECGRIVRVATSSRPFVQSGDGVMIRKERPRLWQAAMRVQAIDDLRNFLGRIRENRKLYNVIAALQPDIVLAGDPDTLYAGELLKRDGAVLVYDSRELWLDKPVHVNRRLFRMLYGRLERRVSREADLVVTVNRLIGGELSRRYGIPAPLVVLNGALGVVREPSPVHEPVRLLFQGSFAEDRGLPQLIDAMHYLGDSAVLYLQGWGGIDEELREKVAREDLEHAVVFVPPCSLGETSFSAREYDVGVFPYVATTLHQKYTSPNKLFDYLGGGLAVALSDLPLHREIVETYDCGVLIDARSGEGIAEGIRGIISDPQRLWEMKVNALSAGREYAWAAQGRKLVEAVRVLLPAAVPNISH